MTNTLEIDSVILEFKGKRVLQNLYLKSQTEKITGLLGRNGCGKSCLMNILMGELKPSDKSIRLNGSHMNDKYTPKNIRYLPQTTFIPISLRVNRVFKDLKLEFSDFTDVFPGFEKYYKSRLKSLSGGERRIIEIYSILASKTKFCLLDEPFSQIMPVHIESIKKLIQREKTNKGIIITDHLYKDIIDICDDLYLINEGKTHLITNLNELEDLGYISNYNKSH